MPPIATFPEFFRRYAALLRPSAWSFYIRWRMLGLSPRSGRPACSPRRSEAEPGVSLGVRRESPQGGRQQKILYRIVFATLKPCHLMKKEALLWAYHIDFKPDSN
ncbi:MAG TPA: hypothetical protein VGQ81_07860 [Acidobacteriota bacterium]|nr:hypothetical protein [Acidobacteriota bacterium]